MMFIFSARVNSDRYQPLDRLCLVGSLFGSRLIPADWRFPEDSRLLSKCEYLLLVFFLFAHQYLVVVKAAQVLLLSLLL